MRLVAEKAGFLFLVARFLGNLSFGAKIAVACSLCIGASEVISNARVLFFFLLFFGRVILNVSHFNLGGM